MNHKKRPFILLSFDVEEFDMPLEYGQDVPEQEQLETGYQGLETLMEVIAPFHISATFFTTANFAQHYPDAIRKLSEQHEVASHTFYHGHFATSDLLNSRLVLEEITGKKITGLRMPRMKEISMTDVAAAGYSYDASMHPTWLPGRYNHLKASRTTFVEKGITRIPASVTPHFRLPLFWLTFKNISYSIYRQFVLQTLKNDGYVCLYFHPWEFINLDPYKIPAFTRRHAGFELQKRLSQLLKDLQEWGDCITMQQYVSELGK